jgi:hypothetical protein
MTTAVSIWLIVILAVAGGLKAWQADRAAAAFATYGVESPRVQRGMLGVVVAFELGLAGALTVGAPWAAGGVAALLGVFALVTAGALLAGRGGRPCACLGGGSRLRWSSSLGTVALALVAGALALGWLPSASAGYDRWVAVGMAICVAAIVALGLAVAALAREVGVLRLQMGGQGALEIMEEGPELGAVQAWAAAIPHEPGVVMRLAVFTSEGCPLCRRVAPAVAHVSADPLVSVRVFDEVADASVWMRAAVPGSPYAIAIDRAGAARAKGTFNSLAQLESILGTARARERGLPVAA